MPRIKTAMRIFRDSLKAPLMEGDYLSRFDRIVAILIHLQSGRVVRAQELADRFQVSLRTVYRDIRSLEASGVPVVGEAGVGYYIMEGYRLPPVMFTREEAGSFVAAEKLMQKFSDRTLGAYYESAMYKVKSVLRGHARDRVAALEKQIWANKDYEIFNEHTPDALDVLLDSIADKKQVALQYKSPYSDQLTDRIIEPIGLFHENHYWYVMAYCQMREDYRQFRTDRMLRIQRTGVPFTREHENAVDQATNNRNGQHGIRVVIRVDKDIVKYIKSGRQYYGFVEERPVGDRIEMTFITRDPQNGLARWYLMFGDCAEIVEPESFRKRVGELLEQAKAGLKPLKQGI